MQRHTLLILALLGTWLTGCASGQPTDVLVEYRREGGIAGLDDHLRIAANGSATLVRRNQRSEITLDGNTLNQLVALLDGAGFTKLPSEYAASRAVRDAFKYSLTYKGHTVRTMDTAVPDVLQPALNLLNRIVERGGKP
jgi:anaerobic glycerol-3-phosphate dehydrogenase